MLGLDAVAEPTSFAVSGQPTRSHGRTWAEMVLRQQAMPLDELRVVLTSADHEVVRRHLELHQERLDEWLASQKRCVREVRRILAEPRVRSDRPRSGRRSGSR
jgi:hypothetical protein